MKLTSQMPSSTSLMPSLWPASTVEMLMRLRGEMQLCVRALEAGGAGQPREGARNAMHTVRILVR
ncbi:MAG: hypothetical protein WBW74_20195 [Xanthobacteraceae bacterium]